MCSMPVPSLPQVHPMRLGLWAINFGACADPELQVRAAVAAEESGFESIWTSEHVAMPIRDNPVPMPPETPFLDSIVSLANVAAHTSRLLGVSFKERGAITDEYLQAIRVLWTEEVPRFAGRFAAFDGIRFEPKPRQRPHPPIVIGGRSPRALRRAARFASGWYGFGLTVDGTAAIVGELRRLRVELGRGAEPLEISLTTFEPLTPELVERATEVGIDRLIVMPTVPGDRLEATVRALGARFASGPPGRQPSDQSE